MAHRNGPIRVTVRGQRGITQAELLVALTIGGILAAISLPTLVAGMQAFSDRGAPREIYAQLQRARSLAVTENNHYRVKLVGGSPELYEIHDDGDNDGVENDGTGSVVTRNIRDNHAGVSLSGTPVITFRPNGSASPAGTITVTTASGWSAGVSVSPAGRVRIQ